MRYDRIKECKKCGGRGKVPSNVIMLTDPCPDCNATGEISTPSEHTEMWMVYDPNGLMLLFIGETEKVAWLAYYGFLGRNFPGLNTWIENMRAKGYTCEQIHIIKV